MASHFILSTRCGWPLHFRTWGGVTTPMALGGGGDATPKGLWWRLMPPPWVGWGWLRGPNPLFEKNWFGPRAMGWLWPPPTCPKGWLNGHTQAKRWPLGVAEPQGPYKEKIKIFVGPWGWPTGP